MKTNKINHEIESGRVMLVSDSGDKLGIFLLKDAIRRAESEGLDLVQVSPDNKVPVCKVFDYKKYVYDRKKKAKKAPKKKILTKEIRLTPATDEGDLVVKVNAAKKFISQGHNVKVTIRFKGRQHAHKDLIVEKMNDVVERIDNAKVEQAASFGQRNCNLLLSPNNEE